MPPSITSVARAVEVRPGGERVRRGVWERGPGEFNAVGLSDLFDIDPVGERFLVRVERRPLQVHLVTNWFDDLRKRVP